MESLRIEALPVGLDAECREVEMRPVPCRAATR